MRTDRDAAPARPTIRPAQRADADAVCAIYNAGIAGRQATFETEPREPADVLPWFDAELPFLVATDAGRVVGWEGDRVRRPRRLFGGRRARRVRRPRRAGPRDRPAAPRGRR